MNFNNKASRLRREILIRTAELESRGRLEAEIERLPYAMTGEGWETVRCCVHHDRAILRLRIMAALGSDPDGLDDAAAPLSDYAAAALKRNKPGAPPLSVIGEACNACARTRFLVTEVCQGCLARPCAANCPKNAVAFVEGRAKIDSSRCVNCGLCMKNCPFSAIVKVPVPCEEACPVGAISKDGGGKARIDREACVHCGKCLRECPFGAVVAPSEIIDAARLLKSGAAIAALVAPAVSVQFPGGAARLAAGLAALGFTYVAEVAEGALITGTEEARELLHLESGKDWLASSCCPSWTRTARLKLPHASARLSSAPSPLAATAALARRRYPEAALVFIGPCLAKRAEVREGGFAELSLTAEELGALFVARGIDLDELEPRAFDRLGETGDPGSRARGFAASGGVSAAIQEELKALGGAGEIRFLSVDGVTRQSLRLMELWMAKKPEAEFVEVMACEGGCVAGPCVIAPPRLAKAALVK